MNRYGPIPASYHPLGIFGITALILIFGGIWLLYFSIEMTPLHAGVIAWALIMQGVQWWISQRNTGRWYRYLTQQPLGELAPKLLLRLRWPSFLLLLAPAVVLGGWSGILAACVFAATLPIYYPWQRAMYERSKEMRWKKRRNFPFPTGFFRLR